MKTITTFGAFVEILPGKDGLLHVSEMDWKRIEDPNDFCKEGDVLEVLLKEIDAKTGKMRLSTRDLKPKPEGWVDRPERPRGEGGNRGPRREGGDRGPRREGGDRRPRHDNE